MLSLLVLGCGRDSTPTPTQSTTPPYQGAQDSQEAQALFEGEAGKVRVSLEVVATAPLIQQGLMHRRHMEPNHGMLFVFSSERTRSFWMKNTLIPLDMIFVTSDMTIAGIVRDTEPLTLDSRTIGTPTQYVIEVNAGWTEEHGIRTGSAVLLQNLPAIKNAPL